MKHKNRTFVHAMTVNFLQQSRGSSLNNTNCYGIIAREQNSKCQQNLFSSLPCLSQNFRNSKIRYLSRRILFTTLTACLKGQKSAKLNLYDHKFNRYNSNCFFRQLLSYSRMERARNLRNMEILVYLQLKEELNRGGNLLRNCWKPSSINEKNCASCIE